MPVINNINIFDPNSINEVLTIILQNINTNNNNIINNQENLSTEINNNLQSESINPPIPLNPSPSPSPLSSTNFKHNILRLLELQLNDNNLIRCINILLGNNNQNVRAAQIDQNVSESSSPNISEPGNNNIIKNNLIRILNLNLSNNSTIELIETLLN